MNISDPIADLLTRIRNALMAEQKFVDIPYSTIKGNIVTLLKKSGFINDFLVNDDKQRGKIRVYLKYTKERISVIKGLKRISKPSLRQYVNNSEIPRVLGGLGISIVSTSQGLLEGEEARKRKIGGELLCLVW